MPLHMGREAKLHVGTKMDDDMREGEKVEQADVLEMAKEDKRFSFSMTKYYKMNSKELLNWTESSLQLSQHFAHETLTISPDEVFASSEIEDTYKNPYTVVPKFVNTTGNYSWDQRVMQTKKGGFLDAMAHSTDAIGQELLDTAFLFATGSCTLDLVKLTPKIKGQKGGSAFIDLTNQSPEAGLAQSIQRFFMRSNTDKEDPILRLLYAMHENAFKDKTAFGQALWDYAMKVLGKDKDGNVLVDGGMIDYTGIMATIKQIESMDPKNRPEEIVVQLTSPDQAEFLKFFKNKDSLLNQVSAGRVRQSVKDILECKGQMNYETPNIFHTFSLEKQFMPTEKDGRLYVPDGHWTRFANERESLNVLADLLDDGMAYVGVRVLPNKFFGIKGDWGVKLLVSNLHASTYDWPLLKHLPSDYKKALKQNGFPRAAHMGKQMDADSILGIPYVEAFLLKESAGSRSWHHMCSLINLNKPYMPNMKCKLEMQEWDSVLPTIGKSRLEVGFTGEDIKKR